MAIASCRERLEQARACIDAPAGEGKRACLTVYRESARAAAEAADARAKAGISLGPLDGAIVSIKDLFDVVCLFEYVRKIAQSAALKYVILL